jgi:hypothetical protein
MYSSRSRSDLDRDEDTLRRYDVNNIRASLGLLDYPLAGPVRASFSLSYNDSAIIKRIYYAPENDSRSVGFTPALSLRSSSWDGYLMAERSLSLSYTYHLALEGDPWHEARVNAVYGRSVTPGFIASIRGAALWRPNGNPLVEEHPRLADILPGNFAALHYASFQAGLEKCLARSRFGTLTIGGGWQTVFSSASRTGDTFDHGPMMGARYYLRRIAIPALGVGLAYNMASGIYQFSFNAGTSF